MKNLSPSAQSFLSKHQRNLSTTDRQQILESFEANQAPVFEPLIEFQQEYSGYEFMAGLETIYIGLLQGDGGYPVRTGTAIIEFSEERNGLSRYLFECATSNCPIQMMLDEYGRYYQDNELVASSFDKLIEHLAIWHSLKENDHFKIVAHNHQLNIPDLHQVLNLPLLPEASDEYTAWYSNGTTYLSQCNGLSTIITADNTDKIISLLKSYNPSLK